MNIVFVVHAISSCWNNGNAHFLRGVVTALQALGHQVTVLEPADGWSRTNLRDDAGEAALAAFRTAFPTIRPVSYTSTKEALEAVEEAAADLVVVHEWNEPALVGALGTRRKRGAPYVLLFHDTHHRAVSAPEELARFDLSGYDGVLAFGRVIADIYEARGWGQRVWTWHEAADVRRFHPIAAERTGDLVWIGNWGDGERTDELREFLLDPATSPDRLRTSIYGVRYPARAVEEVERRAMRYCGWLANHRVPEVFAQHRVTVHVPRRPYATMLPGIPTIRVFEALACGIPLVSAPWRDTEGLFPPGAYLTARDGAEMTARLRAVLSDEALAASMVETGLAAVADRHTCDHRAEELLAIHDEIAVPTAAALEPQA